MAQQQIGEGGLAALACYTVDSDYDTEEEEEGKSVGKEVEESSHPPGSAPNPPDVPDNQAEKPSEVVGCKDFGDMFIKEEPEDVIEGWSVDRVGVRDPTVEAAEFMELQEVKVEIESEEESDSDSSSSSDSEEELDNKVVVAKDDAEKDDEGPPRTKNEILPKDLPPVEDLDMTVNEADCLEVGEISSTVDDLVVIESNPGLPALDLESVLFLEKGAKALGRVFDVIGPVTRPFYVVRFNNEQHIRERGVTRGMMVYFAPKTEHTTFVFLEQLMKMKISDASWFNDEEPPPQFIEYSDDEQETRAKQEKKIKKMVEKGADENTVMAKRGRFDEGRARQERGRGRGGTRGGRGGYDGTQNGGQPSYCNNMYTAQTNPFYRSERGYDPRQGQVTWGQYGVQGQYYQYGQQGYPQYTPSTTPFPQYSNTPSTQYSNTPSTQYSNTPSTQYSKSTPSSTPHHALAGASWHSQYQNTTNPYQQLSGNIARMQQPPQPPPMATFGLPPPPPPPGPTFGLLPPPPPPPGTE